MRRLVLNFRWGHWEETYAPATWRRLSFFVFLVFYLTTLSITKTIWVKRRWKVIEIGELSIGSMKRNENKQYSKKHLSQCHSFHHNTHMDWPEIECGSPWWQAGNAEIPLLHLLSLTMESTLQTPTLKPVEQVGFAPKFPAPGAACQ